MNNFRTAHGGRLGRALMLALFSALVSLTGCGGGGGGEGSTGSTPQPPVVLPSIAISSQPSDQNVVVGTKATFKLSIAGTATVQWQSLAGGTWTDLAGATGTEYAISKTVKTDNARQFRAVITAPGASPSSLTSATATLTVTVPISWTTVSPSFVGYSLNLVRWIDDRVAVALGGNGVIVRTADAGLNWSLVHDGADGSPNLLSLNVLDAKTLIATDSLGAIVKSTDAGLSWSPIGSPTGKPIRAISFSSALVGIASDADGKLLRTTDGGMNWTVSLAPGNLVIASIELRGQLGVAYGQATAGGSMLALRSTDGGATWSQIDFKRPAYEFWNLSFSDDNTMYATGNGWISLSTDGGLSWKLNGEWSSAGLSGPPIFTQGGKGISSKGEYRTTDGGLSWTTVSAPRFAQSSFALSPAGIALSVGSQGQIQRSSDFGATWGAPYQSSGLEGLELRDIAFSSEQEGLLVASGGALPIVARTTDGGLHWSRIELPAGLDGEASSVAYADSKTAVVASWRPLRTTDGGQTWKAIDGVLLRGMPYLAVRFSGASLGIMVDSERILRSTDAGLTWTEVFKLKAAVPTPLGTIAIRGSTIVVGGLGIMLRSTDAGLTWKSVAGFNDWVQSISWVDDQKLIAVTTQGKLQISVDAGLSWTSAAVSGRSGHTMVGFSADGKLGFLAGAGNLLRTTDGGLTWTVDLSGRPYNWTAIAFASARNPVLIGTQGLVMTGSGY